VGRPGATRTSSCLNGLVAARSASKTFW
jgi:hypothetical protein